MRKSLKKNFYLEAMKMSDLYFMKREPENEYHARSRSGEFLSSHMLAEFRRSPFRYHQKLTGAIADPDKAEYAFGRAAHKMILEGHAAFEMAYTVSDGPVNERTGKPYGKDSKAYQEWLAEQEHEVVSSADYETIFAMDKNILAHPVAPYLIADTVAEGVVRAEYCSVPCQIRMDAFSADRGIVDLKTCADIEFFEVDARRYGYILQMAFYRAVLHAATGIYFPVHIIAVDKTELHIVGVWQIPDVELEAAERINAAAIRRLSECRERNRWPTLFEQKRILTFNN